MIRKSMQKRVEKRLAEWADWMVRNSINLGYPTQSILYQWLKQGCVTIQRTKSTEKPISFNDSVDEMERCIVELSKQEPKLALALRLEYLTELPIIKKSRKIHISYAQFTIYLRMAKQWLAGRLSRR